MSPEVDDSTISTDEAPLTRASLVIKGFGDSPDSLSDLLNLVPTRSGRAGNARRNVVGRMTDRLVRGTYWALHSDAEHRASISLHIANLLAKIGDSRFGKTELPLGTRVTLRCTVIPNGDLPLICVESHLMHRLGELGVSLEIDIVSVEAGPES